jgi:hypothetical protein
MTNRSSVSKTANCFRSAFGNNDLCLYSVLQSSESCSPSTLLRAFSALESAGFQLYCVVRCASSVRDIYNMSSELLILDSRRNNLRFAKADVWVT